MFYVNENIPCTILNTEGYLKWFLVILLELPNIETRIGYVLVYINYLTKMNKFPRCTCKYSDQAKL